MEFLAARTDGGVSMSWLRKVRGILGKITDALLWGRKRGLWSEKHNTGLNLEKPHKPGEQPR